MSPALPASLLWAISNLLKSSLVINDTLSAEQKDSDEFAVFFLAQKNMHKELERLVPEIYTPTVNLDAVEVGHVDL